MATMSLTDHLEGLKQLRQELTQELQAVDTAIGALAHHEKPKPRSTVRQRRRRNGTAPVSKDTQERIYTALQRGNPDGMSPPEIMNATGVSRDTVRRGLIALREQQRVRKAGRKPGTNTSIFKVIPAPAEPPHEPSEVIGG